MELSVVYVDEKGMFFFWENNKCYITGVWINDHGFWYITEDPI